MRTLRDGRPWFLTAQEFDCLHRPDCITESSLPSILLLTGPVTLSLFTKAQSDCDLVAQLLDENDRWQAGTRVPLKAGTQAVTLSVTINQPLADGTAYHWEIYLTPAGSDSLHAFAWYNSGPTVARAITPAIQIVAFPPVLASPSNFTVRVKFTSAEPAVAVVNLLDSGYNWHGGGMFSVSRGDGLLDVPVVGQAGVTNGNYVLESFLSNSSTNWQSPMARSPNFPVRVIPAVQQDLINAVAQPPTLPAGEVFRFVVDYAAAANRDLHIDLFDANTNFLAGALQPVPPGSGFRDMTISFPEAQPGEYFITAFITPTGQSWTQASAWSADRRVTVVGLDYQWWLASHWGVVLGNDPVNPQDDPDGDGASNADEFAAMTNPRNGADVLKAQISKAGSRLTVSWRSAVGCHYQLVHSPNLSSGVWTPVGGPLIGTGEVIQVPVGEESETGFHRVQVVP
jgi:hypothetical protein